MHPTRIFKNEQELLDAWNGYKEHLKQLAKEWLKVQYVGKEGDRVTDEMKLPYTMDGFEVFCYNNYGCVNQYFDNKDSLYNDFVTICSRVRKEIRENQITGGMLGVYNPSITQRLNGLVEKTDSTVTATVTSVTPQVINTGEPIAEKESDVKAD